MSAVIVDALNVLEGDAARLGTRGKVYFAVEHRRWLVRATNSGVSAVVDPAGRVVARTGLRTRETLRATVLPLDGATPYTRYGDWPGWLALAVIAWGKRGGPARPAGGRCGAA